MSKENKTPTPVKRRTVVIFENLPAGHILKVGKKERVSTAFENFLSSKEQDGKNYTAVEVLVGPLEVSTTEVRSYAAPSAEATTATNGGIVEQAVGRG